MVLMATDHEGPVRARAGEGTRALDKFLCARAPCQALHFPKQKAKSFRPIDELIRREKPMPNVSVFIPSPKMPDGAALDGFTEEYAELCTKES